MRKAFLIIGVLSLAGVAACDGSHLVNGTVDGLADGESVVLQNNGKDDVAVSRDGAFSFTEPIADGDPYVVSVASAPDGKYCVVSMDGVGVISGNDVSGVRVACWERWGFAGTTWLAAGQSNMEAEDIFADEGADVNVLTFSLFKGGQYLRHEWVSIGEAPHVSSVGGAFAVALSQRLSAPVHIATTAESSTPISCWQETGECFDADVRQFSEQRFDGVLWWHGETEALRLFDEAPEAYEVELETLIAQWRSYFHDPLLPFFIVELQCYREEPEAAEPASWSLVRRAQYEVAQKTENVFVIPSTDITQAGYLHPGDAYGAIGDRLAGAAVDYLNR